MKKSTLLIVTVFLAVMLLTASMVNADPPPQPQQLPKYLNNPVVAVVDGKKIFLDDLKNSSIQESMVQLHSLQNGFLRQKIMESLKKSHPEIFVEKIPLVHKEDIILFYKTTPGMKEFGSLRKMEKDIKVYLEKIIRDNYFENIYQQAVLKGFVMNYFKPPNDFRLTAGVGTAKLWFHREKEIPRKVFLLEFSDFQCPFCKRVQRTLVRLRTRYAKEVQFGYRHFPLPFHKEAKALAEAVECAGDQGRFWQLQDLIYNNTDNIKKPDHVLIFARKAGIKNIKAFESCWKKGKYRNRVLQDINYGAKLGIQSTPTFIVGLYNPAKSTISGEMFSGAASEKKFVKLIEKYLTIAREEKKACAGC